MRGLPRQNSLTERVRDVAHIAAHLLVVVKRQRGARQGGRAADGSHQRRYDVERVPQVLDGSARDAVEKIGGELFTIVHKQEQEGSGTAA